MVVTTRTALLGALASVVAAQSVEIYIPGYGRYEDSLAAESVGESSGVTTYLVGCGPMTVGTTYCDAYRTGVGRDDSPPLCTGSDPYNTYTEDSCILTAGATLLQGPSTISLIYNGDETTTAGCSAAGTVSAVCTITYNNPEESGTETWTETESGSEYAFFTAMLTTGWTANVPLPTLQAGVQASTTSVAPSTTSTIPSPTPTVASTTLSTTTTSSSTSTTPSTSSTPSTISTSTSILSTSSSSQSSASTSVASNSSNSTISSSSSSSNSTNASTSSTTTAATIDSSSATSTPTAAEYTGSGSVMKQWVMGVVVMAMFAVAATL